MQQVKLFVGTEDGRAQVEQDINEWLAGNPGVRITQLAANIAPQTLAVQTQSGAQTGRRFNPSDLFVMVVYEQA